MAASTSWLNLTDLGRIYGISAFRCGRALEKQGWRDQFGQPTDYAIQLGAANKTRSQKENNDSLWNSKVCGAFLEKKGFQPISRSIQIEQWTQLLEALDEGSPSINTTAEQMAEDLPEEFIAEVNDLLAKRGCIFRAKKLPIAA